MTDHLPECPVPAMEAGHGPLHPEDAEANCICDELRACEQRVLDAAREAVAALPMMKIAGNFPLYDADDVIAAIDELRGGEK